MTNTVDKVLRVAVGSDHGGYKIKEVLDIKLATADTFSVAK